MVTKMSNLSTMHAKRPPNICYYHLIKAHIGRRIYTLRYTTFMESCMPLCTMTACIFSMVTGWHSARPLLYKPSKALALKQLQHRGSCSYFKPAVIQLFTSKKYDLQKKNKAFMVCQSNLLFGLLILLAGRVGDIFRIGYLFPRFFVDKLGIY